MRGDSKLGTFKIHTQTTKLEKEIKQLLENVQLDDILHFECVLHCAISSNINIR
jgi:hypothetical protein